MMRYGGQQSIMDIPVLVLVGIGGIAALIVVLIILEALIETAPFLKGG